MWTSVLSFHSINKSRLSKLREAQFRAYQRSGNLVKQSKFSKLSQAHTGNLCISLRWRGAFERPHKNVLTRRFRTCPWRGSSVTLPREIFVFRCAAVLTARRHAEVPHLPVRRFLQNVVVTRRFRTSLCGGPYKIKIGRQETTKAGASRRVFCFMTPKTAIFIYDPCYWS